MTFFSSFTHDEVGQRSLQYDLTVEGVPHESFNEGNLFGVRMSYTGWRMLLKRLAQ